MRWGGGGRFRESDGGGYGSARRGWGRNQGVDKKVFFSIWEGGEGLDTRGEGEESAFSFLNLGGWAEWIRPLAGGAGGMSVVRFFSLEPKGEERKGLYRERGTTGVIPLFGGRGFRQSTQGRGRNTLGNNVCWCVGGTYLVTQRRRKTTTRLLSALKIH